MYLTKSDFKAAFDCRTRLFYRKNGYPSASDDNEFLRMLADGGFMIEFIAKTRYPEGVDLADVRNPQESAERTRALLAAGDATLFEAGFIDDKFHVRTDVLRKRGNVLELIEVKSSGVEDNDDADDASSPFLTEKGTVYSRWQKYLLDLAFQSHVVRRACPDCTVIPILCVVNKAHTVAEPETLGRFTLRKDPDNAKARPEIGYNGDLAVLRDSGLLTLRNVERETAVLMEEVVTRANELAALIEGDQVRRVQEPIEQMYNDCRKCDYRVAPDGSGFAECWGGLAAVDHHILDLYRVGQIKAKEFADPVGPLIASGRASLLDLREDQLGQPDSTLTKRRTVQWKTLRDKLPEHLPAALRDELAAHQLAPGWPLHFIDFEACDIALPHHPGLHPFERSAFQWSCHTVDPDGVVRHSEWLNDRREFPNFEFVRTLRDCIGDAGTVYVWSHYEQTTLRKIFEQLGAWLARDEAEAVRLSGLADAAAVRDLVRWLEVMIGPPDKKGKRPNPPRIRDLYRLTLAHYFHPGMGGRASIKVVLPSICGMDQRLRENPCFARYFRGNGADPYAALEPLPFGDNDNEEDAVREGTGAIRVYQDLIFSEQASAKDQANRRKLLLQYCELDTNAMVMIWAHWVGRYDLVPR